MTANKSQRQLGTYFLILGVALTSVAWANLTLASTGSVLASQTIDTADQEFKNAFTIVREAEAAGAESSRIKEFIDRINLALNLTDKAQAAIILDQVTSEASQLRDAALQASLYRKIFTFAMAPVAALIVTICVHYGMKLIRQNRVEQTMKMKIKTRGKSKIV